MSTPSRPVAPFLPPEISAKILHFIHPKNLNYHQEQEEHLEFAPLSRISVCWREEGQRRLFETITIKTSEKLATLGKIARSGPGFFIASLAIEISEEASSPQDSHLIVVLLKGTPNLKFLSFFYPRLPRLNSKDKKYLNFDLKLASLVTLQLKIGLDQEWNRMIVNRIIQLAGNLERLIITGSLDYNGPRWSSTPSSSLKYLRLQGSVSTILEGYIWQVYKLSGLESLDVDFLASQISFERNEDFFQEVGPNLKALRFTSSTNSSIPLWLWDSLPNLETLDIASLSFTDFSNLPETLKKLELGDFQRENEFDGLINLRELLVTIQSNPYTYNLLPFLDSFTIIRSQSKNIILDSLESLRVGMFNPTVLILGLFREGEVDLELSESKEIIDRCKELGINLKKYEQ